MKKKELYEKVLAHFREQMPNVNTELEFGSVFQLLVAVILSAQCTDKRINQVTPELFRHYPDAKTMAQAEPEDILEYIRSVSYQGRPSGEDGQGSGGQTWRRGAFGHEPTTGSARRRQEDSQRHPECCVRKICTGCRYSCLPCGSSSGPGVKD